MPTNKSLNLSPHTIAVIQALFVTFLWSTSWVLIKIGLNDIPALTFAGLRYFLAFLILLPLFWRSADKEAINQVSRAEWQKLIILGLIYYAITHGAQFVSIALLPAITANLILGFSPIVVILLSRFWLAEKSTSSQWVGTIISIAGLVIYFFPILLPEGVLLGLVAAFTGVAANAVSAILGRSINQARKLSPLMVTTITMGIGASVLLVVGIITEGWPNLSFGSWLIIIWLALVNTAVAFTLWNHTLRTLPALESSIINNSMSIQIPILAVIFLGERLSQRQFIGLVTALVGILLVQLTRSRKP